jgi:CBS-domain-containing membrane protein
MSAEIVGCSRGTPIASIARPMATHQIDALFVLDDSRRPVGLVSDVDLPAGEWLGTDRCNFKTLRTRLRAI